METTIDRERICDLCGETIKYQVCNEDGMDWLGHQRGSNSTHTINNKHSCDKIRFKRMCTNCEYNKDDKCTNNNIIKELKQSLSEDSPFYISINSVKIKNITSKCNNWRLSDKIIERLFENNEY